ncbi:hypothetical protein K435DRAFT_802649 [Dendrothele bispora CBS 962.96]|uniref:Uncharacterized protein n=1 Tax=Dendrothele bispora (strain CBS 962.96) TaxID=1314807 RepID=A0A4S8LLL7_DENBC|nr:hypothetical protein K435DRAFT_802649 [Dendrothele bispora CBS 962.96]
MATMDSTAQVHFRQAFAFDNFISAVEGMISPDPATLLSLHNYWPSKRPAAADLIRSEALGLGRQGSGASEQPPPASPAHTGPVPTPSMPSPQPVHASPTPTPTAHSLQTPATPSQVITVSPVIAVATPSTPSRNGSSSRQGTPSRRGARSAPARRREVSEQAQHYFRAHGWDANDVNEVDEMLSEVRNMNGFVNRMEGQLDVDREIAGYVWSVLDTSHSTHLRSTRLLMARTKQTTNFERMLRAARKQSSSTRRPWRHRTKRAAIKLTKAQKAQKKQLCDSEKERYQKRLKEVFASIVDAATALKEEFGKHDVQWYLDEIMQTYRLKQKKRKVGPFQAFVRVEMNAINSTVPEGQRRKKIAECIGDIGKKWAAMSNKEQKEATSSALKELEDGRENREMAHHNSSISAFHDVRTTIEDTKLLLQRLNSRTGVESMLLVLWVTSERVGSFFELAFKQTPHAIALRLEGYCISGVEGVACNYVTETIKMKKDLVKLINEKLKIAGGKTHIPRMYYKNFDDHITAKHGIKVINWPLEKFCCPILHNAWESGTTSFYKMTKSEWKEWEEKRFEDAVEGSTSGTVSTPTPTTTGTTTPAPDEATATPPESAECDAASQSPVDPSDVDNSTSTLSLAQGQSENTPSKESAAPAPVPQPVMPVAVQEKPKRGRKRKAVGEINFMNTTAVVGANGDVVMQKPQRKQRSDAGKARGKREQRPKQTSSRKDKSTK